MRRTDKDKQGHQRSNRIFQKSGQWYFKTREGNVGPFVDKLEACTQLEVFIRSVDSGILSDQSAAQVRSKAS